MSEVARGTYRYWRDGELQAIEEPWSLTRTADTLRLAGERRIDGTPRLAVAADYAGGSCTGLAVGWRADPPLACEYRLHGDLLEWRSAPAPDWRKRALPGACLLFPLLRAASGPLLRELLRGPRWVVLPSLRDPADAGSFLRPELSQRHALAAHEPGHCRYYGGEYGESGSDYWLDASGLVTRYEWKSPQGRWEVRLEDAWVEPGFVFS